MNDIKLAYLAGFFDGEGCISVARCSPRNRTNVKTYHYLRIKVSNKDRRVIDLFADTFKCGSIYKDKRNDVWDWATANKLNVRQVLNALLPHLIIKKTRATLALKFHAVAGTLRIDGSAKREQLAQAIKEANH